MAGTQRFLFGPFRLESTDRRLYRGNEEIRLRPKTFAVLLNLVEHAGRLVKKDELLDAVWPDTAVTDSVLKVSIRELREALEDDAREARFIHTEHGGGYRFIGSVSADNLPLELTRFVGREDDIAALKRMLFGHRFVTMTGPGGVGKSRLALRVARSLADAYRDGVWWVELASLSDARFLAQTVASTLGIRSDADGGFNRSLQRQLRTQELLIVLDNCEHLVDACAALVSGLVRACEGVTVLTTSREPLGTSGEQIVTVQPLVCPRDSALSAVDVSRSEAARLFVERAAAVAPGFTVTDRNARALADICRRLDGIPLAIELASTRVRSLRVEQIASRLDHCFDLLVRGNRGELPRHQTLTATIDWSVGLLSQAERDLFVALAVFAGGWSLEAAEFVCDQGARQAEDTPHEPIVDLLVRLVDKSLVVAAESDSAADGRYRFLETVRQYARAKLQVDTVRTAALHERHARHYLAFAEGIEPHINTSSRASWIGRLDVEHDNLRAALEWGLSHHPELALRLAASLRWFWFHRGYWTEGRAWLDQALMANESSPNAKQASMRARALLGTGVLAWTQGDRGAARRTLEDSVTLARTLGDDHLLAESTHFLANEILAEGDARTAHLLAQDSVNLYRRVGDDAFGLAVTLATLGIAAMSLEDYVAARETLNESAAVARNAGDKWALSLSLRNLGIVAYRQGDTSEAQTYLRESLAVLRDLREKWFISRCFETMAAIAALEGDCQRAARLFGAGEILREAVGASLLPAYRPDYERGLVALRSALGEADIQAAWAAGRAMTLDEAVLYALAEESPRVNTSPSALSS
jgi:non-specific serine/threonine protein kinase